MKRPALALTVLALLSQAGGLRLLFIGNSHTYVNDVPGSVRQLALSAGYDISVSSSTAGGYSFRDHTLYQPTLDSIAAGHWDYVILQEQSQIPTIPRWRDSSMFPSARILDSLNRGVGAATALFVTWGWRDGGVMVYQGDSSPNFRDYFEMQDSVTAAYRSCAELIGADCAPVGPAFRRARERDSLVQLWQADASHATPMGSYLAACVFFSYFFGRSAHGLYVAPDVNDSMAAICWDVSWEVVAGVTEQTRTTDTRRSKLTVNPNPCPGGPTVCVDPSLAAGDRLVLYDAAGRVAWSGLMPAGCRRVALPRLHAGCYILRTESGAAAVRLTVVR